MRDSDLAQIRARLIAEASKPPPPKRARFGLPLRAPARAEKAASPAAPEADDLQPGEAAPVLGPVHEALPFLPPAPRPREAFGRRREAPEPPMPPPAPLEAVPADGWSVRRRLAVWAAPPPELEVPYHPGDLDDPRAAASLPWLQAAEPAERPEPMKDFALADDLAVALDAVGRDDRAEAPSPAPASDAEPAPGFVLLTRLRLTMLDEQQTLAARMAGLPPGSPMA